MFARRRVLSFLGAAPIAAKAAADEITGKLTSLGYTNGLGANVPRVGEGLALNSPTPDIPWSVKLSRAGEFLRLGIPPWLEDEMRRDASYVDALDPDLAAKRSWSMAVKIAEQRQRNYQRRLQSMLNASQGKRNHEMLSKLLGFDWPW